eukprot:1161388-Pelagomonas_calceolata.AAC.8
MSHVMQCAWHLLCTCDVQCLLAPGQSNARRAVHRAPEQSSVYGAHVLVQYQQSTNRALTAHVVQLEATLGRTTIEVILRPRWDGGSASGGRIEAQMANNRWRPY